MKTYHLTPDEDDWELFIEGRPGPLAIFETKNRAITHAVGLVAQRKGLLTIHRESGTIEAQHAYADTSEL
jgi:hypothetical protein